MNTEISIKTGEETLAKADKFAKSNGYSLERLMEGYIRFLAEKEDRKESDRTALNEFLQELHSEFEFSLDVNAKRDYRRYLIEKYK